jgi:hypothetical protein
VNALLRRACFKPLAKLIGSAGAAIATFGCSAAFHEYQFALTFGRAYRPGRACVFFATMAALCFAQSMCEKVPALNQLAASLPRPVAIACNMALMSPFGHLFVDIWLQHGMIATIGRMAPTVKCTSS